MLKKIYIQLEIQVEKDAKAPHLATALADELLLLASCLIAG